jgi:hypothetical protein
MKKRSPIWKMTEDEFKNLVKNATSYREILKHFGFTPKGGNLKTVRNRIIECGIDDSHIKYRSKTLNAHLFNKISDEELFRKDSADDRRKAVKRRLIENRIMDHTICSECGMKNVWNNKPINFVLDHINGIPNDHRIENLRFLCPNCNSQTQTFCARKNRKS